MRCPGYHKTATCHVGMLLVVVASLLGTAPATALDGWNHAFVFTVDNPGDELVDHQVKLALAAPTFDFDLAQADGADVRVTEPDVARRAEAPFLTGREDATTVSRNERRHDAHAPGSQLP